MRPICNIWMNHKGKPELVTSALHYAGRYETNLVSAVSGNKIKTNVPWEEFEPIPLTLDMLKNCPLLSGKTVYSQTKEEHFILGYHGAKEGPGNYLNFDWWKHETKTKNTEYFRIEITGGWYYEGPALMARVKYLHEMQLILYMYGFDDVANSLRP